jgi:DNA-directed RNA polymerase specialized sigma24 family protein/HJR/Mrr/RecB family endonuclease
MDQMEEALKRWSKGDASAFGHLFQMAMPDLVRIARAVTASTNIDAGELVNNIFVSLVKAGDLGVSSVRDFLLLSASLMKRDVERLLNAEKLREKAEWVPLPSPNVASRVEELDRETLMAELAPKHRLIIKLLYEGYAPKEAAKLLGMKPSQLKKESSTALASLTYLSVTRGHRPDGEAIRKLRPEKVLNVVDEAAPEKAEESKSSEVINAELETINSELVRYLAKHPEQIYQLQPRNFEVLVAHLLIDMGYDVELTPPARDGGRDILAVLKVPAGKILTIVECKRYAPDHRVGVDIVERFLFTVERDKASFGLIASTSSFTEGARALERQFRWRLGLRDFNVLKAWLDKYGCWTVSDGTGLWLPGGEWE